MARFLIEVPHDDNKQACLYAKRAFYRTGSHFMTNADWGCQDDNHKAWLIVEVDTKEDAERILPPDFRETASIITLEKIGPDDMEELESEHGN